MLLEQIDKEYEAMKAMLIELAEINSYSYNLVGLDKVRARMKQAFLELEKNTPGLKLLIEELELEDELSIDSKAREVKNKLAKCLSIKKLSAKPGARKILLMGHMDTVFPEDSGFDKCVEISEKGMNGPGVSDLKGGLVVMLKALEAFEKNPEAENIEWQVFLNSDEEIGSPGSQKFFSELAEANELGLIYEPSLSDGSVAYRRKGTGNYQLVVRGKAAHVGREFDKGASAILSSAEFITKANKLNSENIIVNFGKIQGGGPLNVVPDLAITGINVRIEDNEDGVLVEKGFDNLVYELNLKEGIEAKLYGKINRKPKIPNQKLDELFTLVESAAKELGQEISRKNTGGCCDGNNLYESGLVNIDTLGVRGGKIHSHDEFVCLDSLTERAKLSCLVLQKLAVIK